MSHFTNVPTQIKDIRALAIACDRLGVRLVENGTARGWNGNTLRAPYVIQLKGSYDAALTQNKDGTFSISADWSMGKNLVDEIGKHGGKLLQMYGAAIVHMEAESLGMKVEETLLEDGKIRFRLYQDEEVSTRLRY